MRVALVGNQNSGKTSLFNVLTGSNQKVGNWPGVTIEKKEGVIAGEDIEIVDLPGIYSLSPYTEEEKVSVSFLLNEKYDVIVNVVDSLSMERSLYLSTELMELDAPIVLAFNMIDLLEKKNIKLKEKELSNLFCVPAVKISAKTKAGIGELIEIIKTQKTQKQRINIEIYDKIIEKELEFAENEEFGNNKRQKIISKIKDESTEGKDRFLELLQKLYGKDAAQIFAEQRYKFISAVLEKCLTRSSEQKNISEKIDKFVLSRWLALPLFVCVFSLIYFLSVGVVGSTISGFVQKGIVFVQDYFFDFLTKLGASNWAVSLVVHGVLAGVGAVLNFVPQLVIIFLCISLLETSGYMSRVAFIFDKIFRTIGLSGKSLIPFIVGSGCSVPAIMTTKTMENHIEKEKTTLLVPFIPCSAKLPVIALFASFFFPNHRVFFAISLYFFAILIIVFAAIVLKKFIYKDRNSSFISELPDYKIPNAKYVLRDVISKTKDFIFRAGTIIFFSSVVIWFLSSFGLNFCYGVSIDKSILSYIGRLFAWFFYPVLGSYSWAASVSAIQGLVAKEQVVSSLTVIAEVSSAGAIESIFASSALSFFSKSSAYAFVVFNLFSAPCIGAIGAMRTSLGSGKKTFVAVFSQIIFAWGLASLVRLFGTILWGVK